jgi:hypothetical protein
MSPVDRLARAARGAVEHRRWLLPAAWSPARAAAARAGAAAVIAVAAAVMLARFLDGVSPMGQWFAWDLLRLWGWQVLLGAAWACAGHLVLGRLLGGEPPATPPLERWALAGAVGLVVFAVGMYAAGFLGLYGRTFAVAWPLVMIAAGARAAGTEARAAVSAWRARRPTGPVALVAAAFGAGCLGLLYLGLLSPNAINYDAAWMHVTIAQDYAREGRIVPFPGDWVKSIPHLASLLYTWGYLVPGFDHVPQRWMMALHVELLALLWTLAGVAAVVHWLIGDAERKPRAAWAALFLFPGIFVYDSNLGGAADHVAALFAAPLFLTAARLAPAPSGRRWVLLGLFAGAAVITKLQTGYLLLPVAAGLALAWGRRVAVGPRTPGLIAGPMLALAAAAAIASLHFGKSLHHHGNPFYPFLQDWFASTPTFPDAASHPLADPNWRAPGPLGARLGSALRLTFTFAFTPHYSFVNNLPVFGPLFTLSLLLLPVVKAGRRLWLGAAIAVGAVFIWAATYRVDRNLQIIMPLLAAVTGAVLWKAWQLGQPVRAAVAALVAVQVLWSGDLMFSGKDRIQGSLALITSGFDGRAATRYASYRSEVRDLSAALPPDAVVVLHTMHGSLGLDRRVLLDWMGFQSLIDYRTMQRSRDLHDRFRALGVTHVVVGASGGAPPSTRQEELVFSAFLARHARLVGTFGWLMLYAMPAEPPPRPPLSSQVLLVGQPGYADGVYRVGDLATFEALPRHRQGSPAPRRWVTDAAARTAAVDSVAAVMLGPAAPPDPAFSERLLRGLQQIPSRNGTSTIYLRDGF